MRSCKFVIIIVLVFFIGNIASAAEGCLYGGQVYRDQLFTGSWQNSISSSCPSNASNSTNYAKIINEIKPKQSCRLSWSLDYGVLVEYDIAKCPIDDYIPQMLLGVSGFGFLFIRRRLSGKSAVKF